MKSFLCIEINGWLDKEILLLKELILRNPFENKRWYGEMSNEVHSLIVRYLTDNHRGYFSLTSCNSTNYWYGARNTKAGWVWQHKMECFLASHLSPSAGPEGGWPCYEATVCLLLWEGRDQVPLLLTDFFAVKTWNLTSVLSKGRQFLARGWGLDLSLSKLVLFRPLKLLKWVEVTPVSKSLPDWPHHWQECNERKSWMRRRKN